MTKCMGRGICMVYRKYEVGYACISSLYDADFELSESEIHPSVH